MKSPEISPGGARAAKTSSSGGRRLPILTYHSIDDSGSVISVSPRKFRSQMRRLKTAPLKATALSDVAARLCRGEGLPARSFVLTFDDGFQNFYREAYPVLREMEFPATVFLVPGYCGRNNRWPGQWGSVPSIELLRWEEIRSMSGSGLIDFGAHTLTHRDLSRLPFDSAIREVRESKEIIENQLGRPVQSFAYPYGKASAALRDVIGREFSAACSTELGFVTPRSEALYLPRIDMYYFARNNLLAGLESPMVDLYLKCRRLLRSLRTRT